MVIQKILAKLSGYTEGINLRKFKVVSKQCLNDPSNSHKILKKEFLPFIGVPPYTEKITEVAEQNYQGFVFDKTNWTKFLKNLRFQTV